MARSIAALVLVTLLGFPAEAQHLEPFEAEWTRRLSGEEAVRFRVRYDQQGQLHAAWSLPPSFFARHHDQGFATHLDREREVHGPLSEAVRAALARSQAEDELLRDAVGGEGQARDAETRFTLKVAGKTLRGDGQAYPGVRQFLEHVGQAAWLLGLERPRPFTGLTVAFRQLEPGEESLPFVNLQRSIHVEVRVHGPDSTWGAGRIVRIEEGERTEWVGTPAQLAAVRRHYEQARLAPGYQGGLPAPGSAAFRLHVNDCPDCMRKNRVRTVLAGAVQDSALVELLLSLRPPAEAQGEAESPGAAQAVAGIVDRLGGAR